MEWWESIVRIQRGSGIGSGVFIGEDLILTAGHVVQPMQTGPPTPGNVTLSLPYQGNARIEVQRVLVHERWESQNALLTDMAVIRVERVAGAGLSFQFDFGADGSSNEVALSGYPAASQTLTYQTGFIRTVDDSAEPGYRYVEASDFEIAPGVSGSPFLAMLQDGNVYVVGIATWANFAPSTARFNGLPLLPSTFGHLVDTLAG